MLSHGLQFKKKLYIFDIGIHAHQPTPLTFGAGAPSTSERRSTASSSSALHSFELAVIIVSSASRTSRSSLLDEGGNTKSVPRKHGGLESKKTRSRPRARAAGVVRSAAARVRHRELPPGGMGVLGGEAARDQRPRDHVVDQLDSRSAVLIG